MGQRLISTLIIINLYMNLNQRFWEIDALRGVAIIMMVTYHLIFDLFFFGVFSFDIKTPLLSIIAYLTASIFLFLVGISLTLSYNRAKLLNSDKHAPKFTKYLKRGIKIFGMGLVITLITYLIIPQNFIVFGVLHFIGLAIILEYPLLDRKNLNLLLGIIFIVLGVIMFQFNINTYWGLWLGLKPLGFSTVDYFPLFPWLGVVSFGIFAGNLFYKDYTRRFNLKDRSNSTIIQLWSYLGRHSLTIYLLHQPIILGLLYIMGFINPGFL